MICILFGHNPKEVDGTGKYAGRTMTFCQVCGNPLDDTARRLMQENISNARGYESASASFFAVKDGMNT